MPTTATTFPSSPTCLGYRAVAAYWVATAEYYRRQFSTTYFSREVYGVLHQQALVHAAAWRSSALPLP